MSGAPVPGLEHAEEFLLAPVRREGRFVVLGLGDTDGGFGGYQAILKGEQAFGAASEMRKDGLALAY